MTSYKTVIITKKIISLLLSLIIVMQLIACNTTNHEPASIISPNGTIITESFLTENTLTEAFLYESIIEENIIYEQYIEEKKLVENTIKEQLLAEDFIYEILLVELFYLPYDNPNNYIDYAIHELFGENIDVDSLITKFAVGTGVLLTLAVVRLAPLSTPISILITSVAKEAGVSAFAGTIFGTISGALLGATNAIDKSGNISLLISFGLCIAGLITSALLLPTAGAVSATLIIASTVFSTASTISDVFSYQRSTPNVDLANINWEGVGYNAAEGAIEGAVNGFMFGAIFGAMSGAARVFNRVDGKLVIQDNSAFDPNYVGDDGRTNVQRMKEGNAPIGHDGEPVNLHHIGQRDDSTILEIQASRHRSEPHPYDGPSRIDRPAFDRWRAEYWVQRAAGF